MRDKNQVVLPLDLGICIPEGDLVFKVAEICESLDYGVHKEDYGFRRFLTRGKKNIETQFFLLAFALNIEKLCNRTKKGRIGLDLFALNAS